MEPDAGLTSDGGALRLGSASRRLRRALRPIDWVVLEDVALDARPDAVGRLVAPTSARQVAEHLGLTPGAVAGALARLRSAGHVTHARQAGPAGRFGLSVYKRRLADAPAVVAVAAELGDVLGVDPDSPLAWLALVKDARGALDAVRSSPLCLPALLPERDLHADRGMSLGL